MPRRRRSFARFTLALAALFVGALLTLPSARGDG